MKDGMRKYTNPAVNPDFLKTVKEVYKNGTAVLAQNVNGVERGTFGVVQHVSAGGDIAVSWENGFSTVVPYGKESVMVSAKGNCLLEGMPGWKECNHVGCNKCGWNKTVYRRRVKRAFSGDFMVRSDGVKTLLVQV